MQTTDPPARRIGAAGADRESGGCRLPERAGRLAASLLLVAAAAWVGAACGGRRGPGPEPPGAGPEGPPDARPEERPEAAPEPETPGRWYWVYVANRSSDVVSRVRFGPDGAAYEKPVEVGVMPSETDGPVGITVSPDGEHWYLTTARGTPSGRLWKYETGTDRRVADVELASSPGPLALAADGGEVWVPTAAGAVSEPATLSVVSTDRMRRVARLAACPAGGPSGVARSGGRAYAVCGRGDLLVEIDAEERRPLRALRLTPGREARLPAGRVREALPAGGEGAPRCGPTAAAAGPGRRIWVACGASGEVVEVGAGDLRVRRRLGAGEGPSALAVTPDGRTLVAANGEGGSVSVIDLGRGEEVARLATSRPGPRAVAVSGDGRYAFVSNAGGEHDRSTVDVFDLRARVRVAEVEVEHGAAGLAFWRSVPVRR